MIMLRRVIDFSKKKRPIFIVSVNHKEKPHVAYADEIRSVESGRISVVGRFSENTVADLAKRPEVLVVVWDPDTSAGFQLSGVMKEVAIVGELDGHVPETERGRDIPQIEWALLIEIDKIVELKWAFGPAENTKKTKQGQAKKEKSWDINDKEGDEDLLRAENEGFPLSRIFDDTN